MNSVTLLEQLGCIVLQFQRLKSGHHLTSQDSFFCSNSVQIRLCLITVMYTCMYASPVDLAVDWLNDKLYWADGELRRIEEYDLNSGQRRVVTSTGDSDSSRPAAMALYPYPNYG